MTTKNRKELTIIDRYGYRTFIILLLILIFAIYLIYLYFSTGEVHSSYLFLSVLFLIIAVIIFVGFRFTIIKKIDKIYFNTNTMIGESGIVITPASAGLKGTVRIQHEEWSFTSNEDMQVNDKVEVISVMDDKVTMVVRKIKSS